jgi:hypothetical protein
MQKYHKLEVLIAIPSTGTWLSDFGHCLCNVLTAFNTHRVGQYKGQTLTVMGTKGSILPKSRMLALKEAKDRGVDYLVFVDTDQTFPRSLIHRLIARDLDVVAANIATKTYPASPTARNKDGKGGWTPVYTDPDSTGVEKIDRIGTGIMCLSKKVIQALPLNSFDIFWRGDEQAYQGEDWSMGDKLEELGFNTYIDHDLSQQVGHVGNFTYTHEFVGRLVDEVPAAETEKEMCLG